MTVAAADRLSQLPPYLFVEIDRAKADAVAAGRDVIDFGVGDPDRPPPEFITECMAAAVRDPANHAYAPSRGTPAFRRAAAEFLRRRFDVAVDYDTEIVALIGAKEGIGHLPTALINPGDVVLCPAPGYPVYTSGTVFAAGTVYTMPLAESNAWLPALNDIPPGVRRAAKLMYLNYPNNPTAAVAPLAFFNDAVEFAREHHILIAHDAAYTEIYFNEPPPSILQIDGACEIAIEFHSLSKTFNMTGWRLAFAAGNADALTALATVKSNLDSGAFKPVQEAGAAALSGLGRPEILAQRDTYRRRRDALVMGLREAGWSVTSPEATIYVWARCPAGIDSMTTAARLLSDADVVAIPGVGMGQHGEGYLRFALTIGEDRIREAAGRIARLNW